MKKPLLRDFAENTYSQFGEDGVIGKIFEIIGIQHRLCVEFGAWDGFYLSNTAKLWTKDWKGILIEGQADRCELLRKNVEGYNCIALNYFVGTNPDQDSLEYILKKHDILFNVDLLSIDIDGNDYYIFESLRELRPRVIVCEFNPTIPYYRDLFAKPGNYFGCSLGSLTRAAEKRNYRLVAVTDVNAFFVRDEFFSLFSQFETDIEKIAITRYYNHVITDYQGEYFIEGEFAYGLKKQALPQDLINYGPNHKELRRNDLKFDYPKDTPVAQETFALKLSRKVRNLANIMTK